MEQTPERIPPLDAPDFTEIGGERFYTGWKPNPIESRRYARRIPETFYQQRDALTRDDDDGDRFNYRNLVVCLAAAGKSEWLVQDGGYVRLGTYNQGSIGSCTGNADAMQRSIDAACDVVLRGDPEDFEAMFSPEGAYALGREVAGMLGRGDGCYGSAMAEAVDRFGTVNQMKIGNYDLSRYSVDTCAAFGRSGAPAAVKEFAAGHKTTAHVLIETSQEAWGMIGQGYALNICSSIGFQGQRNEEGVIRRAGSWSHSMCVSSRRTSPKYGKLFLVHQSWGPNWTGGPYYLDQPVGSFWISWEDLQVVLNQRDTYASSGYNGFVRRRVPDFTKIGQWEGVAL